MNGEVGILNDKKKTITEEAMRLFATKGFHTTSIQEIATQSGVSKGGVYNYFSSKEELLLEVHRYYYEMIKQKMSAVELDPNLSPKEKLAEQLAVFYESFLTHKEFILLHLRENLMQPLEEFIIARKKSKQEWFESKLLTIYGEEIKPYLVDLTILLDGLVDSYIKVLFFSQISLDVRSLAKFVVSRFDDLVAGLLTKKDSPQLTKEMVSFIPISQICNRNPKQQIADMLQLMNKKISDLPVNFQQKEDYYMSIQVLQEELRNDQPKKVVFQGMLSNFEQITEFSHYVKTILVQMTMLEKV